MSIKYNKEYCISPKVDISCQIAAIKQWEKVETSEPPKRKETADDKFK